MGLFQRNIFNQDTPLYQITSDAGQFTTGEQKSLLIIGLGNVGKEYDGTRHNIGFAILDHFAQSNDFPAWTQKKDLKCHESSKTLGSYRITLVKPTTFMNNSGEALQAAQHFYKLSNSVTLAVYDEADIKFGQIQTRTGGSAAGHNGVKSLIQHCGEDFDRVRVGVGPKKPAQIDLADFVLAKFSKEQAEQIPELLKETSMLLSEYCYAGGKLYEETRSFIV